MEGIAGIEGTGGNETLGIPGILMGAGSGTPAAVGIVGMEGIGILGTPGTETCGTGGIVMAGTGGNAGSVGIGKVGTAETTGGAAGGVVSSRRRAA